MPFAVQSDTKSSCRSPCNVGVLCCIFLAQLPRYLLTLFHFPQAKANGLQSCVIIIRVMRDLCSRIPAFAPLNNWVSKQLSFCFSTF